MKRVLTALTAVLLACGLAACGEKHDTLTPPAGTAQPFSVMLDYLPNADHVGLYEALANGDFAQADLSVHVETPSNPAEPLQAAGRRQGRRRDQLRARGAARPQPGHPLVSVAAIVQKPLTSIISVGSKHITSAADLQGKTVGTAGIPYQNAYLQTILQKAGVPPSSVHAVNVGFNLVPAMLSGHVDATLGGYWNYEAIQLKQDGKKPNVIPVSDAGVPTYDELVLVVRKGTIIDHAALVRRFVQALARGYKAARADPPRRSRTC